MVKLNSIVHLDGLIQMLRFFCQQSIYRYIKVMGGLTVFCNF